MKGKTAKQLHEEWKVEAQEDLHLVCNAIQYRLQSLSDRVREKYLLPEFVEDYEEKIKFLKKFYESLTG